MKKIIAITTGILMIMGIVSVSSANAGAARRHTIEGFMLGTGVALLGTAIIHEMNKDARQSPTYTRHWPDRYENPKRKHHKQYKRSKHHKQYKRSKHPRKYAKKSRGHYELERVWINPVYERRWNPGHYSRKGTWLSGRYQKFMIEQGYWSEKKVWVWR